MFFVFILFFGAVTNESVTAFVLTGRERVLCKLGMCFLPELACKYSLSFYIFIFTAARSFALLARGLKAISCWSPVTARLVKSFSSAS